MDCEFPPVRGSSRVRRSAPAACGLLLALLLPLLSACSSGPAGRSAYQQERFESTDTHARSFDAPTAQTCEAGRRALLSQGYVIVQARDDLVTARKSFQPDAEVHLEIMFNVVCAPDGRTGRSALAFVTAVQDRYTLKKVNSSASVGVGALGSLSVPLTSSDESMVKVGSETISSGPFYERFFVLLERFLGDADPDAWEPQTGALSPAPRP